MPETWLILGATSSMARALARTLAERGDNLILAGRDADDLARLAADCAARGAAQSEAMPFDGRDPAGFNALLARLSTQQGVLNTAVFLGSMPAQSAIDADPSLIDSTVTDCFTAPARLLQMLAPLLEQRRCGTVVGVGAVAGDRARQGEHVYGAAKAGFHSYLSGLRIRLARSGVHVLTVKPGHVDTAATWGFDGMLLLATPERVAADILRAVARRRSVIYTPPLWRWIMLILRLLPEAIFKRLPL